MFSPQDIVAINFVSRAKRVAASMETCRDWDWVDLTLFMAILMANIAYLEQHPDLAARWLFISDPQVPSEYRRPITIRALAQSVSMPRETVRRRVARLVAEGVVCESATGVIVRVSNEPSLGIDAYIVRSADVAAPLIAALAALESPDPSLSRITGMLTSPVPPHRALMRINANFTTATLNEFTRASGGDAIDGVLLLELALLSHGAGPTLAGVRAGTLARAAAVDVETTRRRLRALQTRGIVVAATDGYRIGPAQNGASSAIWRPPLVPVAAYINRLQHLVQLWEASPAAQANATVIENLHPAC